MERWESEESDFPSWVMSVFKGSAPSLRRERPGFLIPTLVVLGILIIVAGLSVLRVVLAPGIDANGDATADKYTWSGPFMVAVSGLLVLAAIANWWAVVLLIRNFRRSIRRRSLGIWFQNFVILAVCSTFLGLIALNCLLGAPVIAPRPGGPLPVGVNYFFMLMCSLIPPVAGHPVPLSVLRPLTTARRNLTFICLLLGFSSSGYQDSPFPLGRCNVRYRLREDGPQQPRTG